MPLYEYFCSYCERSYEILHKYDVKYEEACSNCGHNQWKRQVTAASFQLKGSGWYATDFKKKSEEVKAAPTTTNSEKKTEEVAKPSTTEGN